VLSVHAATIRLFLHVLAATVWVGGQVTLVGLLPAARRLGPDAPKAIARQFDRIAWPAFLVLIVTGVWNLLAVHVGDTSVEYQVTLGVKLLLVAVTGVGAAVHRVGSSRAALAVGGAFAGLGAVGALFFGVLLRT
jgi:putative copper export protein